MTENEIMKEYASNARLISEGRLNQAFTSIVSRARASGYHDLADQAEHSRTAYGYMLKYFADGVEDPSRASMYDDLVTRTRSIADQLHRRLMTPDSPHLYYSTLRMQQMQGTSDIPTLVASYDPSRQDDMVRLFNAVWTAFPMQAADVDALKAVISDDMFTSVVAEQITHAVALGLLEFYDEARFDLLISALDSPDAGVQAAAVVGLVTALFRFRKRRHPAHVAEALEILADRPDFINKVQTVLMEYVRALGTKDLTRQIREEVMPDMMRISGEIFNKLRERRQNPEDHDSALSPPDMSELLENSELSGCLRDINERQSEGDDVYLATFSAMKSFPFFREAANWFLPFSQNVHAVRDALGDDKTAAMITHGFDRVAMLCDSDKYSMVFTIAMMRPEQRQMVLSQFSQAGEGEDLSDITKEPESFANAANRIIKNNYRFYELFRRKTDFFNPFSYVINPLDIKYLGDKVRLEPIAGYIFKQHRYDEALRLFRKIEETATPDARRYRALGYCLERLAQYDEAIDVYFKADLLDAGNPWTLRHLGKLLSSPARAAEAVEVYERLLQVKPDDADDLIALGRAQLLLGNYDEALLCFYQAERLLASLAKVGKDLALALLLTGDATGAYSYMERTMPIMPEPKDYKFLAYVELARNNVRAAINNLRLWRDSGNMEYAAMRQSMECDAEMYPPLAIPADELALLFDAALQ